MNRSRTAGITAFTLMLLSVCTLICYGVLTDPVVPKVPSLSLRVGICDTHYVSVLKVREAVARLENTTSIRFTGKVTSIVCDMREVVADGKSRTVPWKYGHVVFALRDQSYGDNYVDQTISEPGTTRTWATILVPETILMREGYHKDIQIISLMHGLAHSVGYDHAYLPLGPFKMVPKGHLMHDSPRHMGTSTRGMR